MPSDFELPPSPGGLGTVYKDSFTGGPGNDTIDGDGGTDTITYTGVYESGRVRAVTYNSSSVPYTPVDPYPNYAVDHEKLRQLIHLAENGPYEGFDSGATLDTGPWPFPSASIWREANGNKLTEKTWIRNSHNSPTTIQWKVYDSDGVTVLATVTDAITYTGMFETARTRTVT